MFPDILFIKGFKQRFIIDMRINDIILLEANKYIQIHNKNKILLYMLTEKSKITTINNISY